VTGGSAEGGIRGTTSGTGGAGVYGINTTNNDYGILGYSGYGVYGYSATWAGYFQGNARVTGNLTVDGSITGTLSETDPQVGTLTNGMWCTSNGSQVNCATTAPVGTLTSDKWCTSNSAGTQINCTSNAPTVSESDPEVGSNTANYIPKWNGSALVTGTIYDNGNIGIGTTNPQRKLHILGANPRIFIEASSSNAEINFMNIGDTGAEGWAFYKDSTSDDLRFYQNGDRMTLQSATGNVGIGTTSPSQKLTVAGTIESTSGGVKFPDGTVLSSANITPLVQNPRTNAITPLDTTGDVGRYTSITMGTDGLPVISYYDSTNGDLKVVKCGNASCSSGNIITPVDTAGDVGQYTSITIGTDGLPVISYYDSTNGDLKVVKCGNTACSSGNIIRMVTNAGDVGRYSSIAIGTDGLPVISYHDNTLYYLKVVKCADASCSSVYSIPIFVDVGFVGMYTSITIGTDGLPIISYYDLSNDDLKVAKCNGVSCYSGNTITTVDSYGYVGWHTSITIGTDGRPVISYYDWSDHKLKVAKCGDADCSYSYGDTITTVDWSGDVGSYTSITIATDGMPVISYYDSTNGNLKVAKCGDLSCSSGNILMTVDSSGDVGKYTSITIGTDGLPVISYYDVTNGDLKVAKCANQFCVNNWSRR
jgi:hypothetical protein